MSFYRAVVKALAYVAGILVAATFVLIVYDVSLRTAGLQPPDFTSSVVEYLLLYVTCLSAPWILSLKGHVFVESFIRFLPDRVRRWQERLVYLICLVLCILFLIYSAELLLNALARGDMDERSITLPRWLLFAPVPVCFALMSVEFARYLAGHDSMYRRDSDDAETL